jgi:hypothetical protein
MDAWKHRPDAEVTQALPLLAEIHKAASRINKLLAPFEQIRKYRVLPRDFSIEQGELTATMKVRRTRRKTSATIIEWTPGRLPSRLDVWRRGKSFLAVARRPAAARSVLLNLCLLARRDDYVMPPSEVGLVDERSFWRR